MSVKTTNNAEEVGKQCPQTVQAFTASQKGEFDNREQIKARREIDNVVEGHYDQQQKRGFTMRR